MHPIDPVADVSNRRQGLKSMQKARRDVQVPKVLVIQFETLLVAESR